MKTNLFHGEAEPLGTELEMKKNKGGYVSPSFQLPSWPVLHFLA